MSDEQMSDLIPPSVQAQIRKAEEMVKALSSAEENGKAEATPPQGEADTGAASPAPNAQQADTAQTAPEQTPPQDDGSFQAKYSTLKGKYDAEVPRLRGQITQLVSEIDSLKAAMQSARTAHPDTGHQPGAATPDTGRQPGDGNTGKHAAASFDPEKFKEYGDDFVQLVEEVNRLKTENKQLKGAVNQVESTQKATTYKDFRAQLTGRVPDLETLNSDPGFLQYLGQVHPFTNRPLIESLREAESELDVERAVSFFDEFKKTLDSPKPPAPSSTPKPPISPRPGQTAIELPTPGKIYSRADITRFFNDKIKGVYTGREAEADKIERDIFAAQSQGRIVG